MLLGQLATLAQSVERLPRNEKVDRRAGFRFLCLTTCGFKSHPAHFVILEIELKLFEFI